MRQALTATTVAYDGTKNLTDFGAATSSKAGPFQFTAEAWQAAIDGPAADSGFLPDDRLDWMKQPKIASILASDATEKFKKEFRRPPTFTELYFVQLLGKSAAAALNTPTKLVRDVIEGNPSLGSYAADLRASSLTVEAILAALQQRLEIAYAEALKTIDAQPLENRFYNRRPPVTPVEPPPVQVAEADPVGFSAFSPNAVERGGEALVQVFLHNKSQALEAEMLARQSDAKTTSRGAVRLDVSIEIGQRIDIVLEAVGAIIDKPSQFLIWRGEPRACQFVLTVPKGEARTALMIRSLVFANSTPAGSLLFTLPVVDRVSSLDSANGMKGDKKRNYRRVFFSYASADRVEVLKRAQAFKALHIDFFQDLLSLEPGEHWRPRL